MIRAIQTHGRQTSPSQSIEDYLYQVTSSYSVKVTKINTPLPEYEVLDES